MLNKIRVCLPVGRPRTRPGAVAADKAYSSRANRAHLRKRRIKAVIPEKKDQAGRRDARQPGRRPVSHDTDLYKERNTVERLINRLKDWRGIATRFDKTPESYLAGLELRALVDLHGVGVSRPGRRRRAAAVDSAAEARRARLDARGAAACSAPGGHGAGGRGPALARAQGAPSQDTSVLCAISRFGVSGWRVSGGFPWCCPDALVSDLGIGPAVGGAPVMR
ncbi:hypothetical protein SHIRM173S_09226 [Streptomyces hirsutus]